MRSMRGSTSSANGFPLIFRLIFRFIFTQPSVAGGAPDSSGPVVYDSDEYFGEMQGGWASFACRGGGVGAGVLRPVVRDSGRMRNWTSKAVAIEYRRVGRGRRLRYSLISISWCRGRQALTDCPAAAELSCSPEVTIAWWCRETTRSEEHTSEL